MTAPARDATALRAYQDDLRLTGSIYPLPSLASTIAVFKKLSAAILGLTIVVFLSSTSGLAAPTTQRSEAELLSVLKSPNSSANQRAQACQDLGAVGGEEAIQPLAELLDDQEFSHYARYGLQTNPAAAASEALLQATTRLEGDLLVGVVNSLGARKEPAAIPRLAELVTAADRSVAVAAAGALAEIGTDEALDTLSGLPVTKHAHLADPLMEGAEQRMMRGDRKQAAKLFQSITSAPVANHIQRSACIGLVDASSQQEAIDLIKAYLAAGENGIFQAGVQCAVRSSDPAAAGLLAAVVTTSPPARQLQLLAAIESRGDLAAIQAVRGAANSDDLDIQAAAIRGLGALGDSSDIGRLVSAALDDELRIRDSAMAALCSVEGENVESRLLNLLKDSNEPYRDIAAQVLGRRRMEAASAPLLAAATSDSSHEVRLAAMKALARIAPPAALPELLNLASATTTPAEQREARNAALASALRVSDRSRAAELVASHVEDAPAAHLGFLFDALGAIGGPRALELVADAADSPKRQFQNEATRVLGGWPTADAAPALLSVASKPHPYRVRALRGYLRVTRQFDFSSAKRVEMVGQAIPLADRTEERQLALAILERHPSAASLKLAQTLLDRDLLGEKASSAVILIAEEVAKQHPAAAADAARKVLEAGGEPTVIDRAQRLAASSTAGQQ